MRSQKESREIIFKRVLENEELITMSIPADSVYEDVVEAFGAFSLAMGFHPNTVNERLFPERS